LVCPIEVAPSPCWIRSLFFSFLFFVMDSFFVTDPFFHRNQGAIRGRGTASWCPMRERRLIQCPTAREGSMGQADSESCGTRWGAGCSRDQPRGRVSR
jgi:hypothetical protein